MCITDLKWENGQLYYYRASCCQWFPVAGGTLSQAIAEEDYPGVIWEDEEGNPPAEGYSACGKATAIVSVLRALVDAAWDAKDDWPWAWTGRVKSAVPGWNLNNFSIYGMISGCIELELAEGSNPADDEILWQWLRCKLARMMKDDYDVPGRVWEFLSLTLPIEGAAEGYNILTLAIVASAASVLGEGDTRKVALSGAATHDQNCECPGSFAPPGQGSNEWYHYWNWREQSGVWTLGEGTLRSNALGLYTDPSDENGWGTIGISFVPAGGKQGVVRLAWAYWSSDSGTDWAFTPFKLKYDTATIMDGLDMDTDPSSGGTFTKQVVAAVEYDTDGNKAFFTESVGFYAPAEKRNPGDGLRWRGLVLAGTGDDPFVA